jgi:hypothetical protein
MIDFDKKIFRTRLIGDGEIAKLLRMSKSWVRKQRFNRRHGLPHELTIDPIMIGSIPRYAIEEVQAWIEALSTPRKVASGETRRLVPKIEALAPETVEGGR